MQPREACSSRHVQQRLYPTTRPLAVQKLCETLAPLGRQQAGCKFCTTGECMKQFVGRSQEVVEARQQFRELDSLEADFQLAFMLGTPAAQATLAPFDAQAIAPDVCDTSTSGSELDGRTSSEACSTSPDDERVGDDDVCSTSSDTQLGSGHEQVSAKRRRRHISRPRLVAAFAKSFLGMPVCEKALLFLLGVGQHRVSRLRSGRSDGRRMHPKDPIAGFSLRKPRKDGVFLDGFSWNPFAPQLAKLFRT